MFFIKLANSVQKGGNRFLTIWYELLHPLITDHKVGCRSIFIDQQTLTIASQGFDDICCLRGTATGIVGGKTVGRTVPRQG